MTADTPNTADVTVAVATAGRARSVARCLDAVLAGTLRPGELLVVDQSDDDETSDVVMKLRDRTQVPIVYLRQERRGLSASRNAAIEAAGAPIVALTDDDCVPSPGWLSALVAGFTRGGEAAQSVTGRVLPLGEPTQGYAVSSRTDEERAEFSGFTYPWLVGTGANTAVVRERALDVGGFDERLGVGTPGRAGEDLDFITRLLRAGAVIRFEPDALVYHERQSRERRRATRSSYGRGVGACCGIWLRERDPTATKTLHAWLGMRTGRLARAAVHGDTERVLEELLVLAGTAGGLAYGVRIRR